TYQHPIRTRYRYSPSNEVPMLHRSHPPTKLLNPNPRKNGVSEAVPQQQQADAR
ncbi:hypothetical protein A2U01_0062668, partial [Trifolium medium]|nr:hypothetical protein [Trifolium medium]